MNLWGEDKRIFTIDVVVYGDARELALILKSQFPQSALNVVPRRQFGDDFRLC